MKIEGACHCRNIRYTFDWPGSDTEIPVRACSCAFCLKHGATYTSHAEARLEVDVGDDRAVSHYHFGHETADFFVCARCGAVPFAMSEIDGVPHAVVNVNTFEGVDPAILVRRVTDFEGETTAERLARRQRSWTPNVTVRGA